LAEVNKEKRLFSQFNIILPVFMIHFSFTIKAGQDPAQNIRRKNNNEESQKDRIGNVDDVHAGRSFFRVSGGHRCCR
jgi:hypothetical protein